MCGLCIKQKGMWGMFPKLEKKWVFALLGLGALQFGLYPNTRASETNFQSRKAPTEFDVQLNITTKGFVDVFSWPDQELARNADGSVCRMNYDSAVWYCSNLGKRLPNSRELALLGAYSGAPVIRETAFPDENCGPWVTPNPEFRKEIDEMDKAGYHRVFIQHPDGRKTLDFYYSGRGYKRPLGDIGQNILWSSSIADVQYSNGPPTMDVFVYSFHGEVGEISSYHTGYSGSRLAVWCVEP